MRRVGAAGHRAGLGPARGAGVARGGQVVEVRSRPGRLAWAEHFLKVSDEAGNLQVTSKGNLQIL